MKFKEASDYLLNNDVFGDFNIYPSDFDTIWCLKYCPDNGTDNSYHFESEDLEELIIGFYEFIKDKSDEYFGN